MGQIQEISQDEKEVANILNALNEWVWYDMPASLQSGVHAKSGLCLTAIIKVLVAKKNVNC